MRLTDRQTETEKECGPQNESEKERDGGGGGGSPSHLTMALVRAGSKKWKPISDEVGMVSSPFYFYLPPPLPRLFAHPKGQKSLTLEVKIEE